MQNHVASFAEQFVDPCVDFRPACGVWRSFGSFLKLGNNRCRHKRRVVIYPVHDFWLWLRLPELGDDVTVKDEHLYLRGGNSSGPMERRISTTRFQSALRLGRISATSLPWCVMVTLPPSSTGLSTFEVLR